MYTTGVTEDECASVCASLGIPADVFDLVLFGDGSGTVLGQPYGWFVTGFLPEKHEVFTLTGGASSGTSNFAELAPYVHALWHVDYAGRKDVKKVLIVSDSELTIRCGAGEYARKKNLALWASIDWFCATGRFTLSWRHVSRNSNPLHVRADKQAGDVRRFF